MTIPKLKQRFSVLWFFNGFNELSLGFHLSLNAKNIEIHLPGGFLRVGMQTADKLFVATSSYKVRLENSKPLDLPEKVKERVNKLLSPYIAKEYLLK